MRRNSDIPQPWLRLRIRSTVCLAGITFALGSWTLLPAVVSNDPAPSDSQDSSESHDSSDAAKSLPRYRTELIRGKVVWLADALKKEFGVSTVAEAAENALALLTPDGELVPIVENPRGRAFRKDERLRDQDMELLVRRYDKQPFIQILRVYQIEDDQRFEVDYWCDVCAIPMYETGPCSCCQDDNRLRKRPVDENDLKRRTLPEKTID